MLKKNIKFSVHENFFGAFSPPVPAKKAIPDWYKKMQKASTAHNGIFKEGKTLNGMYHDIGSNNVIPDQTIKTCIPVRDVLTSGYLILLPCDVFITIRDYRVFAANRTGHDFPDFIVESHPLQQISKSPLESNIETKNNDVFKFMNPWLITTPKGYSTFFTQPYYHELPFEILSGIVDTDRFPMRVNFPFMWKNQGESADLVLKKGTPIAQVHPFKRESWEMSVDKYSDQSEQRNAMNHQSMFQDFYRKLFHVKKTYD